MVQNETKRLEIDQDNLRTGTAQAVARLMSFAQITCYYSIYYWLLSGHCCLCYSHCHSEQ